MNPKVVRKLQSKPDTEITRSVYFSPSDLFDEVRNDFGAGSEFAETLLPGVQNPSKSIDDTLEITRQKLTTHLDEHRQGISDWQDAIEDVGLDVYAEAYEETIANDELAYIEETVALITDVLDTYNREELVDGPDELNTVADRLETISNWPNNLEPYDLQIHRHVTDAVWSAWAAEQTPTPTETDSA